ncbi:6-hydroxynicotinate 3-monooxygenase precursor [Pseudomonas sp. 22 E 5]|uniref:FAD-dependent oxidoreductase n=1 Tax=Pseudomonas brassicacearum TaxID=930166 RepID=UPI0008129025|nr:NAD(P)/FAD-dependent oxidoreductase [Pseudomonas brassicacearum]CAH0264249.1 6-hydroxynicotinate 3-monooxygenase [Pseudomonas brassicacearum]CRM90916.1 6-hydroxynicotinate 3-monooxygenase precursor [Pseudomonas sp. 22 E 5]
MRSTTTLPWRKGKRVAIIGAGPGGVSAALALHRQGYDVRLYEKSPEPKPLGGGVLLSVPVLAILRDYGIDLKNFGSFTHTEFRNKRGRVRTLVPSNPLVEQSFGLKGWHYGMLRSNAFARMMECLPEGLLMANHTFQSYREGEDDIELSFTNGTRIEADVLVGADGIRSGVARQAFGEPELFHVGLRVWLAWCDAAGIDGIPPNSAAITHSNNHQASFFPMLHDGKPGYEWWIVEPVKENAAQPENVKAYIQKKLENWADPLPRFPDATDFNTQIFCWDIYNRPSLKRWSRGRVVCLGDAVHPVSPYAAYGMGMAIEDGYFLGSTLGKRNLSDGKALAEGIAAFEAERVDYVNHHVEFARKLGSLFHYLPYPLAKLRDFVFDRTKLLERMIRRDYLSNQEAMSLSLRELHIK